MLVWVQEEKKPVEEKKPEEGKKEAAAEEEKKEEAPKAAAAEEEAKAEPAPPQEIVLKVFMHCEGCARKVRRCLKGFEGSEKTGRNFTELNAAVACTQLLIFFFFFFPFLKFRCVFLQVWRT